MLRTTGWPPYLLSTFLSPAHKLLHSYSPEDSIKRQGHARSLQPLPAQRRGLHDRRTDCSCAVQQACAPLLACGNDGSQGEPAVQAFPAVLSFWRQPAQQAGLGTKRPVRSGTGPRACRRHGAASSHRQAGAHAALSCCHPIGTTTTTGQYYHTALPRPGSSEPGCWAMQRVSVRRPATCHVDLVG